MRRLTRTLVIEPDARDLELIVYVLEAFDHDVLVATDGARGLAKATREPVDLILCNLQLPIVDGQQIAERLKADPVFALVPLLAIAPSPSVDDRDRILAAGFDGSIGKPIAPEKLLAAIDDVLEPRSLASELELH